MKMLILSLALFPMISFAADKATREYVKSTYTPAITEAQDAFKKACGCALTIKANDSVKTQDDYKLAKYIAESIKDGAAGYCTDADSKKAVCQMKTLELGKAKEATFTFKGGKGVATHDGQANSNWDMMTRELDK
ncbi:MAG: hypothetical protein ABL958_14285 [Bdellovibrionia bacterium]